MTVGKELLKLIPKDCRLDVNRETFGYEMVDNLMLTATQGDKHVRRVVSRLAIDDADFDVVAVIVKDMFNVLGA